VPISLENPPGPHHTTIVANPRLAVGLMGSPSNSSRPAHITQPGSRKSDPGGQSSVRRFDKEKSKAQGSLQPMARSKNHGQPLEVRISSALRVVAELLAHDETYLPVFLRLEAELKQAVARRAALARAKSLLAHRH
jgi:hypothetical protein